MANVSHDLKTPLTMIKAYAEMSTDLHANNKDKQKEDINIIISEVDRLTNLVNDISTLSKIQANIDTLNIEEFDLIELTKDIIKKYSILEETENYNFLKSDKFKNLVCYEGLLNIYFDCVDFTHSKKYKKIFSGTH